MSKSRWIAVWIALAIFWMVMLAIRFATRDTRPFDYFIAGGGLIVCALGIWNQMRRPA